MPEPVKRCVEHERLLMALEDHLYRVAYLSRAMVNALKNRHENIARELDREVTLEMERKDRAFEALTHHSREHGCE